MPLWFEVIVIALVTCIVLSLFIDSITITRGGAKAPVSVPDTTCDKYRKLYEQEKEKVREIPPWQYTEQLIAIQRLARDLRAAQMRLLEVGGERDALLVEKKQREQGDVIRRSLANGFHSNPDPAKKPLTAADVKKIISEGQIHLAFVEKGPSSG